MMVADELNINGDQRSVTFCASVALRSKLGTRARLAATFVSRGCRKSGHSCDSARDEHSNILTKIVSQLGELKAAYKSTWSKLDAQKRETSAGELD